MKIIFVCVAGKTFGNGHFNRCIILKNYLNKFHKTKILKLDKNDLNKNIYSIFKLRINKINPDIIFFDLSSTSVINQSKNLKINIKKFIELNNYFFIFLDSIGSEKLSFKSNKIKRIIPYYVKNKKENSNLDYVVINRKLFQSNIANKINKKIKILITFGGYDIKNTIYTIKALSKIKNSQINIKIIIGKFCNDNDIKNISKVLKDYIIGNYKIYTKIDDLSNFYKWSNIVICSDGTTKYEVAASGRMAIIVRQNFKNYIYGLSFEKLRTAKFINYKTKISSKKFSFEINKILNNKNMILNYSNKSKTIFKKNNIFNYKKIIENI